MQKNAARAKNLESIATSLYGPKGRIERSAGLLPEGDWSVAAELDELAGKIGQVQDKLREIAGRCK